MALITARTATNFSLFNLKTLLGGDRSLQLLDNVDFKSAHAYVYQDLARAHTATTQFDFAGSGITLDGNGAITGGTVTGFLSAVAGSTGFTPAFAIEGIYVSALTAWGAAQTSSGSDDLALLKGALWGDDTFRLSTGADRASGYGGNDTLSGGAGNDTLFGGDGNDSLLGGSGNDYLDGGGFGDQMVGGSGNDTYVVDSGGDVVTESSGGGTDTVRSSISVFSLQANVEKLVLTGTAPSFGGGNALSNTLTGNGAANELHGQAGNDTLIGGAGNDTLLGEAGADSLVGGAGNDTYILFGDTVADKISETATGGIDTVSSDITYTLGAYLDKLELTGVLAINGSGNALNNTITGNFVANRLSGGGGNDRLDGSAGNDTLVGGAGKDTFVFSLLGNPWNNLDHITDFAAADDTIALDDAQYATIGPLGRLATAAFHVGSVAGDASDRIVYDHATGALYYDSDGTGPGAILQFAQLAAGTALGAADFVIY